MESDRLQISGQLHNGKKPQMFWKLQEYVVKQLCKFVAMNWKRFCSRGALRTVPPASSKNNWQNILPWYWMATWFLIVSKVSSALWPYCHLKSPRMCLINALIMHGVFHWVKGSWWSPQCWICCLTHTANCFLKPQWHMDGILMLLLNGRWNNWLNVSKKGNASDRVGRQLNDCNHLTYWSVPLKVVDSLYYDVKKFNWLSACGGW